MVQGTGGGTYWVWYLGTECSTGRLGMAPGDWVWYRGLGVVSNGCDTWGLGVVQEDWVWRLGTGCGTGRWGVVAGTGMVHGD